MTTDDPTAVPDPDLAEAERRFRDQAAALTTQTHTLEGYSAALRAHTLMREYDRRGTAEAEWKRKCHKAWDEGDELGILRGELVELRAQRDAELRAQRDAVLDLARRWEREIRLRQVDLDHVGMAYLSGMVELVREALGVTTDG